MHVQSPINSSTFCVTVRVEETIDLSETVKFVLVYYSGPNVSFVAKAKYGVITGSIKGNFAVSCVHAYVHVVLFVTSAA